jgi:hypothetical protein
MGTYAADEVQDANINRAINEANHDEDMVEMLEKGERLAPRGVYRHYKSGHLYYVLGYALDSTNKSSIHGDTLVVYTRIEADAITTSLTNLKLYTRELAEFCEKLTTNAEPIPRFALVHKLPDGMSSKNMAWLIDLPALGRLICDNDHKRRQITELQESNTNLLEEVRALRKKAKT